MFTHVQYHYVQKDEGEDVYFIHQSQHWLRDHNVGITELYVTVQTEDEYKTNKKEKVVGRAAVPTDKLLKACFPHFRNSYLSWLRLNSISIFFFREPDFPKKST